MCSYACRICSIFCCAYLLKPGTHFMWTWHAQARHKLLYKDTTELLCIGGSGLACACMTSLQPSEAHQSVGCSCCQNMML